MVFEMALNILLLLFLSFSRKMKLKFIQPHITVPFHNSKFKVYSDKFKTLWDVSSAIRGKYKQCIHSVS